MNPPYDETIMENAFTKVVREMNQTKYNITIFSIIPAWDKEEETYGKYKTLQIIKNSGYVRYIRKILKKNARFINYIESKVITPTDIYFIILQKNKTINNSNIDNLIERYWINYDSKRVIRRIKNT